MNKTRSRHTLYPSTMWCASRLWGQFRYVFGTLYPCRIRTARYNEGPFLRLPSIHHLSQHCTFRAIARYLCAHLARQRSRKLHDQSLQPLHLLADPHHVTPTHYSHSSLSHLLQISQFSNSRSLLPAHRQRMVFHRHRFGRLGRWLRAA